MTIGYYDNHKYDGEVPHYLEVFERGNLVIEKLRRLPAHSDDDPPHFLYIRPDGDDEQHLKNIEKCIKEYRPKGVHILLYVPDKELRKKLKKKFNLPGGRPVGFLKTD